MADQFNLDTMKEAVKLASQVKFNLENIQPAKLDTEALREAASFMELMKNSSEITKSDFFEISQAITLLGREKAKMAMSSFVNPTDAKNIKKLEEMLKSMGVNARALQQVYAEQLKIVGGQGTKLKDIWKGMKTGQSFLNKYTSSLTGINISIAGILALILKVSNINDRVGSMSRQISAHWGEGAKNIGTAGSLIWEVQSKFAKTVDEAGAYQKTLAMAGMEREDQVKLANEILAIEQEYGQTVGQQLQYITGLVGNFKELGDLEKDRAKHSTVYMETVRQVTKDIPMLSIEESTKDWADLINLTKAYNADLLGTLGMYKILMAQDLAKELGLGDTPRVIRKQIGEFLVGMPAKLSDGWKAALGSFMEGSETRSMAENLFTFESAPIEQQITALSKFIEARVPDFMTSEGMYKLRNVFMGMGKEGAEMAKHLSEAFAAGKLTGPNLEKVLLKIGKEREAAGEAQAAAQTNMNKLIASGAKIAKNLVGLEQRLQRWIELELSGPIRELTTAIRDAIAWAKSEKMPKILSSNVKEGMANIADLYVRSQRQSATPEQIAKLKEIGVWRDPTPEFSPAAITRIVSKGQKQHGRETVKKWAEQRDYDMQRLAQFLYEMMLEDKNRRMAVKEPPITTPRATTKTSGP